MFTNVRLLVNPSDDGMDVEMEEEDDVPLKKQKVMERCKFWPVCKSGDECLYHHPTTQCKWVLSMTVGFSSSCFQLKTLLWSFFVFSPGLFPAASLGTNAFLSILIVNMTPGVVSQTVPLPTSVAEAPLLLLPDQVLWHECTQTQTAWSLCVHYFISDSTLCPQHHSQRRPQACAVSSQTARRWTVPFIILR